MREYVRGVVVSVVGWALIAMGVFVMGGDSAIMMTLAGILVLAAGVVLMRRPRRR